jgi:hypothetical protein
MTKEEFLAEHTNLKENQIISIEQPTSEEAPEILAPCTNLRWVRDEGSFAIYEAIQNVTVRIDKVKNGRWNGAISVALTPPNTISFRMNLDGLNYDSFSC